MHKVSGFHLRFTGRNTWIAAVYINSTFICDVPVAWADQMTFDRQRKRPKEFLVWFTKAQKAGEFILKEAALIAIATAYDGNQKPRRFKEFTRIFRVKPLRFGEDPKSVICEFIDVVTADTLERQTHI